MHAAVFVLCLYEKEYMCQGLRACFYKGIYVCHVSQCECVPGSRVQASVGGPGAREVVVIVEAGCRAEDSIAALGRLSAVGRATLICHQHRQTALGTFKTLT